MEGATQFGTRAESTLQSGRNLRLADHVGATGSGGRSHRHEREGATWVTWRGRCYPSVICKGGKHDLVGLTVDGWKPRADLLEKEVATDMQGKCDLAG